jgi:hypothetical protein
MNDTTNYAVTSQPNMSKPLHKRHSLHNVSYFLFQHITAFRADMTWRLETLELRLAWNFRLPIIATATLYCGSHPLLQQPCPIVMTLSSPYILIALLRKNYRSPIFGGTLHLNTTTITYEIAKLADSAVTRSRSKCCLVNSLFVITVVDQKSW